jgi:hypothetical protein
MMTRRVEVTEGQDGTRTGLKDTHVLIEDMRITKPNAPLLATAESRSILKREDLTAREVGYIQVIATLMTILQDEEEQTS